MKLSKRAERAMTGAMVGLIVLCAVILILRPWSRAGALSGAPTEFRFRCTRCDHEWTVDKETMESYYGGGPRPLEGEGLVYCTKCGDREEEGVRKKTAFQMRQCPACREFFPPLNFAKDPPPKDANPFICPKCGINMHEWYRKQVK